MLAKLASLKFSTIQHVLVIIVFLLALVGSFASVLYGLPAGTSLTTAVVLLLPVLALGANHVVAFFQNPPTDLETALEDGKNALGGGAGKAGQRGMMRLGAVLGVALLAVVVMVSARMIDTNLRDVPRKAVAVEVAGAGEGCSWFQANQAEVVTQAETDLACVLGQAVTGNTDPGKIGVACGISAASQVLQDLASLWTFYAQQLAEGGVAASDQVCGTGSAPYKRAPACISAASFASLRLAAGH